MGNFFSFALDAFKGVVKNQKLLLLGLDGAGKTTILNQLQLNEYVHTIPTIGFNCQCIKYKNVEFEFWDIGGQDKIRHLWKHYFAKSNCICFVIDSSDQERLHLAKETLENILQDESLQRIPLLILANKSDVSRLSLEKIAEVLNLQQYNQKREWHIQAACALDGEGIHEGFDWVAKQMKKRNIDN